MEGDEIIDLFYTIVDDEELSDVSAYTLLNAAEGIIEDKRDWMVLRTKNKTLSHTASDTYLTAHTLPTNFKRALAQKGILVQYASGAVKELFAIGYEDIESEKDSMGYYAIDYATGTLYLTGAYSETVTIIINYVKRATELAEDVVCVWPRSYGAVLAYEMAQIYSGGIDGDDVNFRMSETQLKEMQTLQASMEVWDGSLQLAAMQHQAGINPRAK